MCPQLIVSLLFIFIDWCHAGEELETTWAEDLLPPETVSKLQQHIAQHLSTQEQHMMLSKLQETSPFGSALPIPGITGELEAPPPWAVNSGLSFSKPMPGGGDIPAMIFPSIPSHHPHFPHRPPSFTESINPENVVIYEGDQAREVLERIKNPKTTEKPTKAPTSQSSPPPSNPAPQAQPLVQQYYKTPPQQPSPPLPLQQMQQFPNIFFNQKMPNSIDHKSSFDPSFPITFSTNGHSLNPIVQDNNCPCRSKSGTASRPRVLPFPKIRGRERESDRDRRDRDRNSSGRKQNKVRVIIEMPESFDIEDEVDDGYQENRIQSASQVKKSKTRKVNHSYKRHDDHLKERHLPEKKVLSKKSDEYTLSAIRFKPKDSEKSSTKYKKSKDKSTKKFRNRYGNNVRSWQTAVEFDDDEEDDEDLYRVKKKSKKSERRKDKNKRKIVVLKKKRLPNGDKEYKLMKIYKQD